MEQETLELMKAIIMALAELRERVGALELALVNQRILEGGSLEGFRDRASQQPVIRDVDKQASARDLTGLVRQLGGELRKPPESRTNSNT